MLIKWEGIKDNTFQKIVKDCLINDCIERIPFDYITGDFIIINLNNRMRTTAGRAWYRQNKIELNYRLLKINQGEIVNTFKHELAHIIARKTFTKYPIKSHGIEFRQVLRKLGGKVERTHSMNVDSLKAKTVKYYVECKCGKVYRLKKKQVEFCGMYSCKFCKNRLNKEKIYSKKD